VKTILAPITLTLALVIPSASFAAPIFFDLRAPEIENIDEVNSFSLTEDDGLTATLTALPSTFNEPPLRDLFLNRTASSFGINVVNTTCGGMEEPSQLDGGCTGESVQIVFDRDVILRNLAVSIFGSLDEGRIDITGAPSIDITSTGLQSLGDIFLAAGDPFSVVYVAGNGFSFDNFTVDRAPEPGVLVLLGLGFSGVIAFRRHGA
jgi:hypothetical protein